jgi:predicted membrane-bound spermidine synthase
MAVLWQKSVKGTHYEVRTAGNSLRLYANGVLHSQYNPTHPVTGSVWDLLMLPAFFYPAGAIRRVLVLGVGGGSVFHLLHRYVAPEEIVGIERDPVHLHVARRFFRIPQTTIRLHEADALHWTDAYRGPPFDMIIEDLFGSSAGEPLRTQEPGTAWGARLLRHLHPDGVLVVNFYPAAHLWPLLRALRSLSGDRFGSAFRLSTPSCENAVAACLGIDSGVLTLRRNLVETPGLNPARRTSRLRYTVRRLW